MKFVPEINREMFELRHEATRTYECYCLGDLRGVMTALEKIGRHRQKISDLVIEHFAEDEPK